MRLKHSSTSRVQGPARASVLACRFVWGGGWLCRAVTEVPYSNLFRLLAWHGETATGDTLKPESLGHYPIPEARNTRNTLNGKLRMKRFRDGLGSWEGLGYHLAFRVARESFLLFKPFQARGRI